MSGCPTFSDTTYVHLVEMGLLDLCIDHFPLQHEQANCGVMF